MPTPYLVSFAYEFYLRIQAPRSPLSGYVFECQNFSKAYFSNNQLYFVIYDNKSLSVSLNASILNSIIGKWNHFSFSYNNYSSINPANYMRILINGSTLGEQRIFQPIQGGINSPQGLCYIGNTLFEQDSDTSLPADIIYFAEYDSPRMPGQFSSEQINHLYPLSYDSFMHTPLLYLKMDSMGSYGVNYYSNKQNALVSSLFQNVPYGYENTRTFLCECYSQPMNVLQIKQGQDGTNTIFLSKTNSFKNGITFDIWMNMNDADSQLLNSNSGLVLINCGTLFKLIMNSDLSLSLILGVKPKLFKIPNSNIYFREWTYLALQISQKQFIVYRNGVNIYQKNVNFPLPSGQSLTLNHTFSAMIYRMRMLNGTSEQASFFNLTYLDGSNNRYLLSQNYSSIDSSRIIFDFIFNDLTYQTKYLKSNGMLDLAYSSGSTILYFYNVSFAQDDNLCGEKGTWIPFGLQEKNGQGQGVCKDLSWYQKFTLQNSSFVFSNYIQSVYKTMTLEFWFQATRPIAVNSSSIFTVYELGAKSEKIKVDIRWSNDSGLHTLGVGLTQQVNGSSGMMLFNNSVYEKQWYHISFRSLFPDQLSTATLFQQSISQETKLYSPSYIGELVALQWPTYLGNSQSLSNPYLGFIRELRIWYVTKSDSEIFANRNIDIPLYLRYKLMHYFKFSADTSLNAITQVTSTLIFMDFIIPSASSMDSPLRFSQDQDLLICPFGLYNNGTVCISPVIQQVELMAYLWNEEYVDIVNATINYPSGDPWNYQLQYALIGLIPNNTNLLLTQKPLFNQSGVSIMNISAPLLNTQYLYIIQLSISSVFYSSQQSQLYNVTLDPSCPSFKFIIPNQNENLLYFYNRQNGTYIINIQNITYCLSQSQYFKKVAGYSWNITQPSNSSIWLQYLNLLQINNGLALKLTQKSAQFPIPNYFSISITTSLIYQNIYLDQNQSQSINKTLEVRFSTDPVYITFIQQPVIVTQTQNLVINASQSIILQPGYENNTVGFGIDCPFRLFRSASDYNTLCYINFKGSLIIPATSYASMNIIPFTNYTFNVTGFIRLQPNYSTQRSINVSWVTTNPSTAKCPDISIPAQVNISKIDTYTQLFPIYNLYCQRSGYVSYYQILNVDWIYNLSQVQYFQQALIKDPKGQKTMPKLNSNPDLNSQTNIGLFNYYDNRLWGYLNDSARDYLQVGETIPLSLQYSISSQEQGNFILTVNTTLVVINTDIVFVKATNKANMRFEFSDSIFIDLSGSYDPQDPGTLLKISWSCPFSGVNYCPSVYQSFVNLTNQQRVMMQWKYNYNYSISVTALNAKSGKLRAYTFWFILDAPPISQNSPSPCPSFDLITPNPFILQPSPASPLIYFTNNVSSLVISPPNTKLQCSSTNYSLVALQLWINDSLGPASNFSFQFSQFTPTFTLLESYVYTLKEKVSYNSTLFLYYLSPATKQTMYYSQNLNVILQYQQNVLIARFVTTYQSILTNQSLSLDASPSFDNLNLFNKAFSFRWQCPNQTSTLASVCPSLGQSKLSIAQNIRNYVNLNAPGLIYTFSVQIYDNNRTSNWVQSKVLILPLSPNFDCMMLTLSISNQSISMTQDWIYPLFFQIQEQIYCDNLNFLGRTYQVQYNDYQMPILPLSGYTENSTFIQLPYVYLNDYDRPYLVTFYSMFDVLGDYSGVQMAGLQINMKKYDSSVNVYYAISGKLVVNLEAEGKLRLEVNCSQYLQVSWICAPSFSLLCSQISSNVLIINYNDLSNSDYSSYLLHTQVKFQAIIQGYGYILSKYVYLTSTSQYNQFNCSLVASQPTDRINITLPLQIYLSCYNFSAINKANPQYIWSLNGNAISTDFISNGLLDKSYLKLKPFSLQQQNEEGSAMLAQITLQIVLEGTDEVLPFSIELNTTSRSSLVRRGWQWLSQSVQNKSYSFLETIQFNINYTGWSTPDSQNVIYSLIAFDGEMWVPILPLHLENQINNFTLPLMTKLILTVRNNKNSIQQLALPIITPFSLNNYSLLSISQTDASTYLAQKINRLAYATSLPIRQNLYQSLLELIQMSQFLRILLKNSQIGQQISPDQLQSFLNTIIASMLFVDSVFKQDDILVFQVYQNKIRCKHQLLYIMNNLINPLAALQQYYSPQQSDQANNLNNQIIKLAILLKDLISSDMNVLYLDQNQNIKNIATSFLNSINAVSLIQNISTSNSSNATQNSSQVVQQIYDQINRYDMQTISEGETIVSQFKGSLYNSTSFIQYSSSLADIQFAFNDYSVMIPSGTASNSLSNFTQMVKSVAEFQQYSPFGSVQVTPLVINVTLYDGFSNQKLNISNLSVKVQLGFKVDNLINESNSTNYSYKCVFLEYNSTNISMSTNGLETSVIYINSTSGNDSQMNKSDLVMVNCFSNHLSSFTVIKVEDQKILQTSLIQRSFYFSEYKLNISIIITLLGIGYVLTNVFLFRMKLDLKVFKAQNSSSFSKDSSTQISNSELVIIDEHKAKSKPLLFTNSLLNIVLKNVPLSPFIRFQILITNVLLYALFSSLAFFLRSTKPETFGIQKTETQNSNGSTQMNQSQQSNNSTKEIGNLTGQIVQKGDETGGFGIGTAPLIVSLMLVFVFLFLLEWLSNFIYAQYSEKQIQSGQPQPRLFQQNSHSQTPGQTILQSDQNESFRLQVNQAHNFDLSSKLQLEVNEEEMKFQFHTSYQNQNKTFKPQLHVPQAQFELYNQPDQLRQKQRLRRDVGITDLELESNEDARMYRSLRFFKSPPASQRSLRKSINLIEPSNFKISEFSNTGDKNQNEKLRLGRGETKHQRNLKRISSSGNKELKENDEGDQAKTSQIDIAIDEVNSDLKIIVQKEDQVIMKAYRVPLLYISIHLSVNLSMFALTIFFCSRMYYEDLVAFIACNFITLLINATLNILVAFGIYSSIQFNNGIQIHERKNFATKFIFKYMLGSAKVSALQTELVSSCTKTLSQQQSVEEAIKYSSHSRNAILKERDSSTIKQLNSE